MQNMHAFFVATFLIRKTVLCTLCHAYQTMKPFFNRYVFPHTSALVSAATLCHSQTCTIKKCKKLNTFNKTTTNYNICTRKSTRSHRRLLPTTNAMFSYTPHTHTQNRFRHCGVTHDNTAMYSSVCKIALKLLYFFTYSQLAKNLLGN